jgi:hypothetical protein
MAIGKYLGKVALISLMGVLGNLAIIDKRTEDLNRVAANPMTSQRDRERIYDSLHEKDLTCLIPFYDVFNNPFDSVEREIHKN